MLGGMIQRRRYPFGSASGSDIINSVESFNWRSVNHGDIGNRLYAARLRPLS